MSSANKYNKIIFDCDGVILDSNPIKITAMELALQAIRSSGDIIIKKIIFREDDIKKCIRYFRANFGKSRFHHVKHFFENFLEVPNPLASEQCQKAVLEFYADFLDKNYSKTNITNGFLTAVRAMSGDKFVVSGSEQSQLITTFKKRNLDGFFKGIFGSPMPKEKIIKSIIRDSNDARFAVYIGDSETDFDVCRRLNLDFLAYIPYSNDPKTMMNLSEKFGFPIANDWNDVIKIIQNDKVENIE